MSINLGLEGRVVVAAEVLRASSQSDKKILRLSVVVAINSHKITLTHMPETGSSYSL